MNVRASCRSRRRAGGRGLCACAACATFDPPQAVGEGQISRGPSMQFDADPLDAKDAAAHLLQQGRRGRRLRRRRRRLWLQLKALTPIGAARAGALLAAALALPGVLPAHAHAQTAPDTGVFAASATLDYRDWQPGARPDDGRNPVAVRADAAVRDAGRSKARWSTTRCRARRRCSSTRCPARRAGRHRLSDRRRRQGHEYFDRYRDRRRRRVLVRARLRLARAGRSKCAPGREDRNRTYAFGFAGDERSDRHASNGVAPRTSGKKRRSISCSASRRC